MSRSMMLGLVLPVCGFGLVACVPVEPGDGAIPATDEDAVQEVVLPEAAHTGRASLEEAIVGRRSLRSFGAEPLRLEDVAQLLWATQGVTDTSRGLRTAPSAGATYPLETYLVAGDVSGLTAGIYRYDPRTHRLAQTGAGDVRNDLAAAALSQSFIAEAPASIVIACAYARTEQRYGDRAERYVHMEAGHAAQNLALQAVSLGLGTVPVGAFRDDPVAALLELPAEEEPLYILPIGRP